MHVIVLGAGVVGTTTAWYLRRAGHEVTVIDRGAEPATETSYANGGQISVSHAEPWANPSAPLKVLRWLFRDDAPLLFRPRADADQWQWCLRFLGECLPGRTERNIASIVALGLYSRDSLRELRAETGLRYDDLQRGILHFYTNEAEFAAAQKPARIMREHGCELEMLSPCEVIQIEPALRHAHDKIVGGSITRADESGDAKLFTRRLAEAAQARGVVFRFGTHALSIDANLGSVRGVCVRGPEGRIETIRGDAFVVCLGSHARALLRPLGINLQIYPAKGYSVTAPVADPDAAYTVSLTDDEYKLVFSRLGDRLRIAGTAELSGYNTDLNEVRCHAIVRRTLELFPGALDPASAEFWTGLRPATPSNVPYIGHTRLANLYLNVGHGTLGFTHSCGSGRLITEIIDGHGSPIDFPIAA